MKTPNNPKTNFRIDKIPKIEYTQKNKFEPINTIVDDDLLMSTDQGLRFTKYAADAFEKVSNNTSGYTNYKTDERKHNSTDSIYYYHTGQGNSGEDISCGKKSKDQLRKMKWISLVDFVHPKILEHNFRQLASLTSSGKMDKVMDDMITHFMSGSGEDYSNNDLTNAVSEHVITQAYMNDFSNVFNELLREYNGDINNDEFKEALQTDAPRIGSYYYNESEILTGLMIAIHAWTENEVSVKEFNLNDDGTYTGSLQFTFKDNFGLDEMDINRYGIIPGFRSWYILQHYDKFNEKYKPFKTVVTINYPIRGSIGEKREKNN